MRGEAVAKHMGGNAAEDARLSSVSRQQLPKRLAGEAAAARGYEKIAAGPAFEQRRPAGRSVGLQGAKSRAADGHQALFIAFASSAENTQGRIDVADSETAELGNSQARGVEDFEHGAIAETRGTGLVGRPNEP